ncbi:MAG: hypothetical protein GX096_05350 [Clostridiales bacterium]|nr:hypothetical protein [Clostridiales bacterium]
MLLVSMCNVMGLTSANRDMLKPEAYQQTIELLVKALLDYAFMKEE